MKWIYLVTVFVGVGIGLGLVYLEKRESNRRSRFGLPVTAVEKRVADGFQPRMWKYRLDEGEAIKAAIGGVIDYVGEMGKEGDKALNITLGDKASLTTVSYTFPLGSTVRVKKGQKVAKGEILAVAPRGGKSLGCLGEANVAVEFIRGGQILQVSEADFR
jgi:hypothetical protein